MEEIQRHDAKLRATKKPKKKQTNKDTHKDRNKHFLKFIPLDSVVTY